MPDLIMGFDPGSSLSKVLYKQPDQETQLLLMEPEVLQLPQTSIDSYRTTYPSLSSAKPQDDAWVQCGKDAEIQVTGYLARQFKALSRLDKLKYETALYKVLAGVGSVVQSNALPDRLDLYLTMVLPYGEYQNRIQLEQQLRTTLKSFSFRGTRLRVKLAQFECRPEGGGLAMMRLIQNGLAWFQRQVLIVLMFGHRNTSALIFERGKLVAGYTTDLGFYQLVNHVIQNTAGQDAEILTPAVYKIGTDCTPDHPIVQTLIRSHTSENAAVEARQIATAIATARDDYWRRLKEWLELTVPKTATEILISGGPALYLKPELEQYFCKTPSYWGIDLQHQIQSAFALDYRSSQPDPAALSFRLVDVFGIFLDFEDRIQQGAA